MPFSATNEPLAPEAIVLKAGQHQHAADRLVQYPRVMSRMLVRCNSGRGTIVVNGQPCEVIPGCLLLLPWGHAIRYEADPDDPMLLSGTHIVPRYLRQREPLVYSIPHTPADDFADSPHRQDVDLPGLAGVVQSRVDPQHPLSRLMDYTIAWYLAGDLQEWRARLLGQLLIEEMVRIARQDTQAEINLPPGLWAAVQFVRHHLDQPLDVSSLAREADCSTSTLSRLFRRHLHQSPAEYILRQRMLLAAQLLRSTSLRVGEIAGRVGIPDPYHFSRTFRRQMGLKATEYRQRHSLHE